MNMEIQLKEKEEEKMKELADKERSFQNKFRQIEVQHAQEKENLIREVKERHDSQFNEYKNQMSKENMEVKMQSSAQVENKINIIRDKMMNDFQKERQELVLRHN